ncbi:zinc finger, c3HC4 type (RING finger) domain-containing protein [Ditylenchus destructor]|nr:zinc finger, c3HC4 type (RING finger) domain-containing protein [Ditylenchus destructor]
MKRISQPHNLDEDQKMAPRTSDSALTPLQFTSPVSSARTSDEAVPPVLVNAHSAPVPGNALENIPTLQFHFLEKFGEELKCPICKNFLSDPMLTKKCLHRFCSSCIQRLIGNGLKTCPSCDTVLPKKVPFKTDSNFASIMDKLFSRQRQFVRRNAVDVMKQDGVDFEYYKAPRIQPKPSPTTLNGTEKKYNSIEIIDADYEPIPSCSVDSKLDKIPLKEDEPERKRSREDFSQIKIEEQTPSTSTQVWEDGSKTATSTSTNANPQLGHLVFQRGKGFVPILPKQPINAKDINNIGEKSLDTDAPTLPFTQNASKSSTACPYLDSSAMSSDQQQPSTSTLNDASELSVNGLKTSFTSSPRALSRLDCSRSPLPNVFMMSQKQRLNRGAYIELVLWPDGSVYKERDLPNCMRGARYIYAPPEATVAHLAEYVVVRAEIEAGWKDRGEYNVEITNVEEERDEFSFWVHGSKSFAYLDLPEVDPEGYVLSIKDNKAYDYIMLSMAHPFRPLDEELTVSELMAHHHANPRKPLKVVYRVVPKT